MNKAYTVEPGITETPDGREVYDFENPTIKSNGVKQQIIQEHNANPEAVIESVEDEEGNTEALLK